jgi:hypothetical protein
MLRKCAFAWGDVHSYFGSVDNCGSWYPYTALLVALDRLLGPSYGQAVVFASTLIVSWLGAYACARALGAVAPAAFLAGWAYAFNPSRQSMFGEFATGEVCAALLVWIIYWIVVPAREPARRGSARFALAAIAFLPLVVLAQTPQLLVALIFGAFAVLAFALLNLADDRRAFGTWAASTIGLGVAASLWWTVPNAFSYAGVAISHPSTPLSVAWTFARSSLLNEIRFCASWVWQYAEYNPWSIEFEHNPWLYASGFVAIAGLIVALIVCRGGRLVAVRFFGALALVMLFIAKGLHPPLTGLNLAFYSLPGMFLFIEPYGAVLIAAAGLSICAALGADALIGSRSSLRRRLGGAFVGLSVAALCWNNLAALTGAIFHEKMNITPDEHVQLPSEWLWAAAYLNGSNEAGGVVVLPPDDHYEADYEWGYRGVDLLGTELFERDVLMPGVPYWYTQSPSAAQLDAAVSRLVALRSPLSRRLLTDLGVRYAVVRNDVHPIADGLAPAPDEDAAMFGGPPVAVYHDIEIYDLGPAAPVMGRVNDSFADDGDAGDDETLRAAGLASAGDGATPIRAAILRALHPVTGVRTIAVRELSGLNTGFAIPKLVGRTDTDSTTVAYDVFNPGGAGTADVQIGVWPREETPYTLTAQSGQIDTVEIDASRVAVWCVFHGIRLAPGLNHLIFSEPHTIGRAFAAFAPPRYAQDQPWLPDVDELIFSGVRAASGEATQRVPRAVMRGALFEAPLSDDPRVTIPVQPDAGAATTVWRIGVSGPRVRPLTCVASFVDGQQYRLADTVRDCLAGLGLSLTDVDADRMRIDWLAESSPASDASARSEQIVLATTPLAQMRFAPASAPRLPRGEVPVSTRWSVAGFAVLVDTETAGKAPLVFAQSYSPTWIAIDTGARKALPHFEALGWRNAWESPNGATVLLVNWLSALGLVLLAFGAAAVVTAWVKR